MGEGIVRESGMDMDAQLCLTWRTSKDLLASTGKSAQYSVIISLRENFEKEIHAYVSLIHFALHLKLTEHC